MFQMKSNRSNWGTWVVLVVGWLLCSPVWGQQDATDAQQAESAVPADAVTKYRVLILGDSISIGYTPHVKELLQQEAVVVRPTNAKGGAENCAGTDNGIKHIDRWLKLDGGNWDVIHFNFGLHDLKHVHPETGKNSVEPTHPYQSGPEDYERQLKQIMQKLLATDAQLILCTTTPVPEGEMRPLREPAMPPVYNSIAKRLAAELSTPERKIQVNDLFAFAQPRLGEIQQPANVHFSKAGSRLLAQQVVQAIHQCRTATPETSAKQ